MVFLFIYVGYRGRTYCWQIQWSCYVNCITYQTSKRWRFRLHETFLKLQPLNTTLSPVAKVLYAYISKLKRHENIMNAKLYMQLESFEFITLTLAQNFHTAYIVVVSNWNGYVFYCLEGKRTPEYEQNPETAVLDREIQRTRKCSMLNNFKLI